MIKQYKKKIPNKQTKTPDKQTHTHKPWKVRQFCLHGYWCQPPTHQTSPADPGHEFMEVDVTLVLKPAQFSP